MFRLMMIFRKNVFYVYSKVGIYSGPNFKVIFKSNITYFITGIAQSMKSVDIIGCRRRSSYAAGELFLKAFKRKVQKLKANP